eukprot:595622-Pelagomonas_calceolata.AAC.3
MHSPYPMPVFTHWPSMHQTSTAGAYKGVHILRNPYRQAGWKRTWQVRHCKRGSVPPPPEATTEKQMRQGSRPLNSARTEA